MKLKNYEEKMIKVPALNINITWRSNGGYQREPKKSWKSKLRSCGLTKDTWDRDAVITATLPVDQR